MRRVLGLHSERPGSPTADAWWDDAVELLIECHHNATRPPLTRAEVETRAVQSRSALPADWPRCVRCEKRWPSIIVAIGLPCEDCEALEHARLRRLFRPYRRELPDAMAEQL